MPDRGDVMVVELLAELSEEGIVKLSIVVDYDDPRQAEMTDDTLQDEVVGVLLNDPSKWFTSTYLVK